MSFTYIPATLFGPLPEQLQTIGLAKEGELVKYDYNKKKQRWSTKVEFTEEQLVDNLDIIFGLLYGKHHDFAANFIVDGRSKIKLMNDGNNVSVNRNGDTIWYDIYELVDSKKVGFCKRTIQFMLDANVPRMFEGSLYLKIKKYSKGGNVESKQVDYNNETKEFSIV